MKKTMKILAVLLAVAMCSGILAACTSTTTASDSGDAGKTDVTETDSASATWRAFMARHFFAVLLIKKHYVYTALSISQSKAHKIFRDQFSKLLTKAKNRGNMK